MQAVGLVVEASLSVGEDRVKKYFKLRKVGEMTVAFLERKMQEGRARDERRRAEREKRRGEKRR